MALFLDPMGNGVAQLSGLDELLVAALSLHLVRDCACHLARLMHHLALCHNSTTLRDCKLIGGLWPAMGGFYAFVQTCPQDGDAVEKQQYGARPDCKRLQYSRPATPPPGCSQQRIQDTLFSASAMGAQIVFATISGMLGFRFHKRDYAKRGAAHGDGGAAGEAWQPVR